MGDKIRQMALISQNSKINKRLDTLEKKVDKILEKLETLWTHI